MDLITGLASSWSSVPDYARNEAYVDGKKRLDALGVSLPPEMRLLELVVDWPRITVEALEERLHVDGFSLMGETGSDDHYWDRWQENGMNILAPLLHTESLTQGIAFGLVGPSEGEYATFSAHTARDCKVLVNGLGKVEQAKVRFEVGGETFVSHYTQGQVKIYGQGRFGLAVVGTMSTPSTAIPVVPFVNRARIRDPFGRSEIADVITYTDAASRTITGLQVATELVALPQRYMLGAKPDDFKDQNGRSKPLWEVYTGRILTGPSDATVGSLPGADLTNIIAAVKMYAGLVSASTGLAISNLGIVSDANPASAEAINAANDRHVAKAEKKQTFFGESHELMQRIADEFEGKKTSVRLETRWRNAATPTLQATSSAVSQLVSQGIVPAVVARDLIGLTEEQKKISAEYDGESTAALLKAVGV